jgi:hypothetical protein
MISVVLVASRFSPRYLSETPAQELAVESSFEIYLSLAVP